MKNYYGILCLIAGIAFTGCKKEADLTAQAKQAESEYINLEAFGMGRVKASDVEIHKTIATTIAKTKTIKSTSLPSGSLLGVFKDSSCGSYSELEIVQDNEDYGNPYGQSIASGNTGASGMDANTNTHMKFCLVPDSYNFPIINKLYAVLNVTAPITYGRSYLTRQFDSESTTNYNDQFVDGVQIPYSPFTPGQANWGTLIFGNNYVNHTLKFYVFPILGSAAPLPNLGFGYYVMGTWGTDKGYLKMDGEDTNNTANSYLQAYNGTTYYNLSNASLSGVIDVGPNTTIYLSRGQ